MTPGNKGRATFSLSPGPLGSGSRPHPQVYVDLIRSCSHAGEYSCCFTELQRDFIVSRPTKLKSLIRLVKHWYRQVRSHSGRGHPAGALGSAPERFPGRRRAQPSQEPWVSAAETDFATGS